MSLVNTTLSDRYRIERLLARGGMADVYLATDQRLERKVAVKVIYPHLAENASFRERFINEAKTAAKLSHPNLVNVYDQGVDGSTIFMVMEYVPGMTLRDALSKFGKLSPIRALELLEQVLQGLAAAHRGGILHRDLKPENIFLADDGRIKLGDFGLARELSSVTNTQSLIGTIAYLSPELITRGFADARSDVYAAGIMLYELVTGEQPFKGNEAAHIAHQHTSAGVPAPSTVIPGLPSIIDEIVLWATAMQPEHRPANAQVLLDVVKQAAAGLTPGQSPTLPTQNVSSNTTTVLTPGVALSGSTAQNATTVMGNSQSGDATTVFGNPRAGDATTVLGDGSLGNATGVIGAGSLANATTVISAGPQVAITPLELMANKRRSRGKIIGLLIAAAAVVSLAAGWWFGSGPGELVSLPNLAATSIASAQETLRPYNSHIVVEKEYSKTISSGQIIRTDPGAGTLVFRGSKVVLWVSKGPQLLAVPSIAGLTQTQATQKLQQAGFIAGAATKFFSTGAPGTVFDYLGSDNAPIAMGSTIPLQISLGPIPQVAGLSQSAAISALQAAGIKVSAVTKEYSDAQAIGLGIRTDVAQTPLPIGGKVVLVVSNGPTTVKLPSMIGETIAATKLALENLGLIVEVNTNQLQANWGLVKVNSVSIAAGTVVKRGTTIIIGNVK